MVFASAIIAYSRYQANLYGKFISLRKDGLYQQTYAAVYQAKDSVLNESMPPIILSFLGSLVVGFFLDAKVASIIWNSVVLVFAIGNNVQIIRKGSKAADQKQQDKDVKKWHLLRSFTSSHRRGDMSKKNQKRRNNLPKTYDIILIFITAFAAPFASHACDVTMGKESNPLSSEKLLCAYFVLIATYVICEFLLGYYKETRLWKKGWMLGNSDALIVSTYIVAAAIVFGFYDTLGGIIFIGVVLVVFLAILIIKPDRVELRVNSILVCKFAIALSYAAFLSASWQRAISTRRGALLSSSRAAGS